eukprot:scaffold1330_cov77-Skeletonema_marinoi.AAC.4
MPAAAAAMNNRSRNNNHHQWTLLAFVAISFCLVIPSFVILGILTNSPTNEDKLFGPSTDVHFLIDQPRTEENPDTSRNNKHPTNNALSNNFNTSTKKRIKRTYNQTSFPGFSKTITTVRCGGHSAPTCTECPNGNGAAWCN